MSCALLPQQVIAQLAFLAPNRLLILLIISLLILAYIITSWVRLPYSTWLNRIQRFLYDVCDPYLRLFRRFLPPLGPLDLSPVVGVAALYVLLAVAINILDRLH